jgi:F0F1-type ATP synthase membrane subunit b/b'
VLTNNTFDNFATLRSSLQSSIDKGDRAICEVLLEHMTKLAQSHHFERHFYLQDMERILIHAVPKLSTKFTDLCTLIFERSLIDVPYHDTAGPAQRQTAALPAGDDIEYSGGELVCAKLVCLPNLTNVDYWRLPSKTDPLQAIVEAELVDAFSTPAVRSLLSHRWRHVRNYFFVNAFLYLLFLGSATSFSLLISEDMESDSLATVYRSDSSRAQLAFGFIALVLNVWFMLAELIEARGSGWAVYVSEVWNYIDLGSHFLVFATAILHGTRSRRQYAVAAVTILMLWFKLLSFLRGFQGSGVFVRLLFAIGFKIRYFLLVWAIVIIGFANAFIILFRAGLPTSVDGQFSNLGTSFVNAFKGAVSGADLYFRNTPADTANVAFADHSDLYNLQLILYVMFTLVANTLMLNMLIALMGSVYNDVVAVARSQFRLERAKLLLSLENLFLLKKARGSTAELWLQVVAPVNGDMWIGPGDSKELVEIKKQAEKMEKLIADLRARTEEAQKKAEETVQKDEKKAEEMLEKLKDDIEDKGQESSSRIKSFRADVNAGQQALLTQLQEQHAAFQAKLDASDRKMEQMHQSILDELRTLVGPGRTRD